MSPLFQASTPAIAHRVIHLDLKGVQPTVTRFLSLLEFFAAARYTAVLIEWEDTFPWKHDLRWRSPTAYTEEEVRQITAKAAALGLELIPLIQTLGHMENFLLHPEYLPLRENAAENDLLNPLAPGAPELVATLVEEVLALMPDLRRFHLGGDEAWRFGTHPDTRAYIEEHGSGALYLHHVEPLLERLLDRGIRPMLWHDMMVRWDDTALARLAPKSDLVGWGYHEHPDVVDHHYSSRHLERFIQNGITLWGATAYKGADSSYAHLPHLPARHANATAWVEVAARLGLAGVITTGWSRYNFNLPQCEVIDAALDVILMQGILFHDGAFPLERAAELPALLDQTGEGAAFRRLSAALREFDFHQKASWEHLHIITHQIIAARLEPQRRTVSEREFRYLALALGHFEATFPAVREALTGLLPERWIESYLEEAIEPIRWQQRLLHEEIRTLLAQ